MCCLFSLQYLNTLAILFLVVVTPVKLTSSASEKVIIINDVTTSIDISTQLVNVLYKISFTSEETFLRSFLFIVDPLLVNNLSYITATGKNVDPNIPLIDRENGLWEIFLNTPIIKHQKESVVVHVIFTHVLKPYPNQIKQHDKHLVLYSGPVSLFSPYQCLNQTSQIILGNGHLESVSEIKNFELSNTMPLTFISKAPIDSNTRSYVKIHYEHKTPFLTVKELYRTIEISHWGSIKVVEEISLNNNGAKLSGPYHRPLFSDKNINKIQHFTTILPSSATDITVYDDIGLVSTVTTRVKDDCVEMVLYPRFLLYGGWKIKYIVSYNVPSYEYLFNDDDNYVLKMRLIDHIFDDMVIDAAVIKIIMPEGTERFSLKPPYSVKLFNETYHLSYLDTAGKPVITIAKTNLVEQHTQNFILNYRFSKFKMLLEPLYIIAFIQFIFSVVIICLRADFTISKEDGEDNQKSNYETAVVALSTSKPKKKKN